MDVYFRKKHLFSTHKWVGYFFFICLYLLIHYYVNYKLLDVGAPVCEVYDLQTGISEFKDPSFCLNESLYGVPVYTAESIETDIYKINLTNQTPTLKNWR